MSPEEEEKECAAAALNEWFQTPKGKAFLARKRKGNWRLEAHTYNWRSPKFRNIERRQLTVCLRLEWGRGAARAGSAIVEIFFTQ